jgi:putative membrane protein
MAYELRLYMKKNRMKRYIYLVAVAGVFAACGGGQPDNVKTADSVNDKRTDSMANAQSVTDSNSAPSKQDAQFMVKAGNGAQFEVVLGHLAETNGANPGVKRFGEMMVRDHTKGGETLRGLAASKQIVMPDTLSVQQEKERKELEKKHGAAFDKAYVKMMVDDHKEDISEFQRAATNANDPDIRALAAANIPILQQHLDSVQNLTMVVK